MQKGRAEAKGLRDWMEICSCQDMGGGENTFLFLQPKFPLYRLKAPWPEKKFGRKDLFHLQDAVSYWRIQGRKSKQEHGVKDSNNGWREMLFTILVALNILTCLRMTYLVTAHSGTGPSQINHQSGQCTTSMLTDHHANSSDEVHSFLVTPVYGMLTKCNL